MTRLSPNLCYDEAPVSELPWRAASRDWADRMFDECEVYVTLAITSDDEFTINYNVTEVVEVATSKQASIYITGGSDAVEFEMDGAILQFSGLPTVSRDYYVEITAYTAEGEAARQSITVTVDIEDSVMTSPDAVLIETGGTDLHALTGTNVVEWALVPSHDAELFSTAGDRLIFLEAAENGEYTAAIGMFNQIGVLTIDFVEVYVDTPPEDVLTLGSEPLALGIEFLEMSE